MSTDIDNLLSDAFTNIDVAMKAAVTADPPMTAAVISIAQSLLAIAAMQYKNQSNIKDNK